MTVRERMLALRLLELAENHPEYASRIGVTVFVEESIHREEESRSEKNV